MATEAQDPSIEQVDAPPPLPKTIVIYCGVCGLPPEYCEFNTSLPKCKKWLLTHHEDLFKQVYNVEDLTKSMEELNASDETNGDDKDKPKSGENTAKAERKAKMVQDMAPSKKVVLQTIERTKRKRVTVVTGLDKFDVELKKAAKLFAGKFATGSSVTKNPQGHEEITIQGDVADDLFDLIPSTWKHITEDDVDILETKKK